jgi:hypothetical protein
MESVDVTAGNLVAVDAAILVTDHTSVDYGLVVENAPLVIDTRGVFRSGDVGVRMAYTSRLTRAIAAHNDGRFAETSHLHRPSQHHLIS